jgi:hypothetical protein
MGILKFRVTDEKSDQYTPGALPSRWKDVVLQEAKPI